MTVPNRKLPPLYADSLERALRTPLPLRSEQHGNYLDLFVDTGHLQLLRNPDWQVVYGRRGTGKTFLLGVLQRGGRAVAGGIPYYVGLRHGPGLPRLAGRP